MDSATYAINVVLFGLSMLVPNDQAPPSGMTVLMPDSAAQAYTSDGCRIPRHEPLLLLKGAKYDADNDLARKHALDTEILKGDNYTGGWNLRGLEVRLLLRKVNPGPLCKALADSLQSKFEMDPNDTDGLGTWPSNSDEASRIGWFWQGSEELQKRGIAVACLTGHPPACPVASRLIVQDGAVKTCKLAALQEGDHTVPYPDRIYKQGFESRDQGQGSSIFVRSRPLPTAARVRMATQDEAVLVVMARELDEVTPKVLVTICPAPAQRDQIWIGNAPLGSHADDSPYCANHDRDRHFELFYLMADEPAGSERPIAAAQRQIPVASRSYMNREVELLQPTDSCEVPALFLPGPGHTPEFTGVCGGGSGKPSWAVAPSREKP